MNAPEKLVTELVKKDVCIPVGLTSNQNDDVVDTAVTYFSLVPSKTPGVEWVTTLIRTGDAALVQAEVSLSSLEYQFKSLNESDEKQKVLEAYQKAILIVDLPVETTEGQWTFAAPGAVFNTKPTSAECVVEQTLAIGNTRLILTIENVVSIKLFTLDFVYKALFTNADGVATTYTSPDPKIGVRRGEG